MRFSGHREVPEPYQQIFRNVRLSEEKQGKSDWATNHGGEFYAIGVGGGVTGRRAHGALLDDLVKDRKEADSVVIRDSTWDWYKTAMRTRLRKDGWIVFVNTRWLVMVWFSVWVSGHVMAGAQRI